MPGVDVGTRYGLRVDGPWDPAEGLRHNVHKLLLDPHAYAIAGDYTFDQRLFGHDMAEPGARRLGLRVGDASLSSSTARSTGATTPLRGVPLEETSSTRRM